MKYDIVKQIERLANPLLLKPAKQILLLHKQRYPHIFLDICLYSEICKLVSQNSYRLGPRRLIQELFLDVNFESLYTNSSSILSNERRRATPTATILEGKITSPNERSNVQAVMEACMAQRREELAQRSRTTIVLQNKNVKRGFNIVGEPLNLMIEPKNTEGFSTTTTPTTATFEARSPPLQMVVEENVISIENLLTAENSNGNSQTTTNTAAPATTIKNTNKTDNVKPIVPMNRKSLESIKFTYNENKFPIKSRDDTNVIK